MASHNTEKEKSKLLALVLHHWVSYLNVHWSPLKGLLKHVLLGPFPEFTIHLWDGPRISISNKVPIDANDAGLGTILWELLLYMTRCLPPSQTFLLVMRPHTPGPLPPRCWQWPWERRSENGGKRIPWFILLDSLACFSLPFFLNYFWLKLMWFLLCVKCFLGTTKDMIW